MYRTTLQLEQNSNSSFRRSKRGARSSLVYKDLDRMLKLGNLETRRVFGDGNCGYYAYVTLHPVQLLRCLIACWSISHATCDDADSWANDRAGTLEFLRRLAMRALINPEWVRNLCLKHSPASGEAT
eukprot:1542395-Pleurochrysis_carterae.AAC.1